MFGYIVWVIRFSYNEADVPSNILEFYYTSYHCNVLLASSILYL